MLNFGPEKMIVIFFIAMIVLGPDKLPEMARKFGKVMGELRKVSGGFQEEMRRVMDDTTGDVGDPRDPPGPQQGPQAGHLDPHLVRHRPLGGAHHG